MAEYHQQPYNDQCRTKQYLAPCTDELLDAKHRCAPPDDQNQHDAQHSIGHDTPCGVEQSVQEHTAAFFNVFADVTNGCNIRCQWTGGDGRQQAQ